MKWILFICATLGLASWALQSQVDANIQDPIDLCQLENQCFQGGEVIVYKLYYNWNFIWLAAGEVIFRVKEHEDHYQLSASGRTYPSYEWFFKVQDYFESKVDKETLLPHQSVRDVHEGNYTRYDKIFFDQEQQKATYYWGKNKEAPLEQGEKLTNECMHDIISIFYSLRNADLNQFQEGNSFPVKVFLDKELWPVTVRLVSKETKQRIKGQGKHNTIHFSPDVIAGTVFEAGDKMNIYVSNDQNKIPLLIESPVSVGSVKAVISSWYGLKHPLESKL